MYKLSKGGRPKEEDDGDDDRPRAPERHTTVGEENAKAFAKYHDQGHEETNRDAASRPKVSASTAKSGAGVAASTYHSKSSSPRVEDFAADDDEAVKPKAAQPTIGAVAVPGIGGETRYASLSTDYYQDSFVNRSPSAGNVMASTQNEPVEARCVTDDEADIEALVQTRMNAEAKDIADMVHKQLMANAAVAEVQPSNQDASSLTNQDHNNQTDRKRKKRRYIIAVAAIVIIAVIGAGIGVALSNNSDTPAAQTSSTERCSFCHDGTIPPNLDTNEALGQSCAAFREAHIQLSSTDSNCVLGQSVAYAYCECPTLPPRPENPSCTVCKSGAVPSGSGCDDIDTLVQHLGSNALFTCENLVASAFENGCTCPGEEPPPSVEKCSFCYDGTTPTSLILETNEVLGQSCGEYREEQIQLASTDLDCTIGQTLAAALCECPTYPPRPDNPKCTLCENGAEPSGGVTCEAIETVIQQFGEDPQNDCDDLRSAAFESTSCTCP